LRNVFLREFRMLLEIVGPEAARQQFAYLLWRPSVIEPVLRPRWAIERMTRFAVVFVGDWFHVVAGWPRTRCDAGFQISLRTSQCGTRRVDSMARRAC